MRTRLLRISAGFIAVFVLAAVVLALGGNTDTYDTDRQEQILAVNELEQLVLEGRLDEFKTAADGLADSLKTGRQQTVPYMGYAVLAGIGVLFVVIIFAYVYIAVLRPFDKMKAFAQRVAQGDLEVPLAYERSNYFGEFTWAFDSMRREITRARSCEKEAVENNKTVIASLSHDIKTPIASIRAYAEGLEAEMAGTPEKRAEYLAVIMRKCDEVSRLTNDLFLHSVSDLDKLRITVEEFELCSFMRNMQDEISIGMEGLHLQLPDEKIFVSADAGRLLQVCGNLINNSKKYAKTDIDVVVRRTEHEAQISFRDYGKGIPDEDMPFIFNKFYRGRNSAQEQGSGLGLYIVKYIMEKMQGNVRLHNHPDGLEAVVSVKLSSC